MIQITPAAAQEIKRIQRSQKKQNSYVKLALQPGGCLDFIYNFSLVSTPEESDQQHNSRSMKILVSAENHTQLQDLNIDFSEDLMGGGFRFTNPTATKTCNCGQSFQQ